MAGGWKGSDRSSRLPSRWHALRIKALAMHKGICHVCNEPGATEVDHVNAGDDHDLGNLRPIHTSCHSRKSSAEGNAKRWSRTNRRAPEPHPGTTPA